MNKRLIVLLGDQRSPSLLRFADRKTDHIMMAEVVSEATYVAHHKKRSRITLQLCGTSQMNFVRMAGRFYTGKSMPRTIRAICVKKYKPEWPNAALIWWWVSSRVSGA
jgi:hypothetical protein